MATEAFDLDRHTSIGALLVRHGSLSDRHLKKALKEQERRGGVPRLGDLLMELGMIDQDQLDQATSDQELYRGVPSEAPGPQLMEARLYETDRAVESVKAITQSFWAVDISPAKP